MYLQDDYCDLYFILEWLRSGSDLPVRLSLAIPAASNACEGAIMHTSSLNCVSILWMSGKIFLAVGISPGAAVIDS